ncbi:MAG: hypothetical protein M3275_03750 [Thermoproteota archaeon]|nr:hypothetical protein [Thermoproteota archaeon]
MRMREEIREEGKIIEEGGEEEERRKKEQLEKNSTDDSKIHFFQLYVVL